MKIRRYIGNNTQEAILKVKMDLGNDALILNTRKVKKKGLFNMLSKPVVEVLAAVDEYYGKSEREGKKSRE
jgi:flagellar biosynthesis protein FlhF